MQRLIWRPKHLSIGRARAHEECLGTGSQTPPVVPILEKLGACGEELRTFDLLSLLRTPSRTVLPHMLPTYSYNTGI